MTLPTEYANWKAKYREAFRKYQEAPDVARLKKLHGNAVRTAWENMIRIVNVLAQNPWTDEIEAEQKRHQEVEQRISDKWRGKSHPLVQDHITFQKADTEMRKQLNITARFIETRPTKTIQGPAIR